MVNEYVRDCGIGRGTYGKVVLYRSNNDGLQYAIKDCCLSPSLSQISQKHHCLSPKSLSQISFKSPTASQISLLTYGDVPTNGDRKKIESLKGSEASAPLWRQFTEADPYRIPSPSPSLLCSNDEGPVTRTVVIATGLLTVIFDIRNRALRLGLSHQLEAEKGQEPALVLLYMNYRRPGDLRLKTLLSKKAEMKCSLEAQRFSETSCLELFQKYRSQRRLQHQMFKEHSAVDKMQLTKRDKSDVEDKMNEQSWSIEGDNGSSQVNTELMRVPGERSVTCCTRPRPSVSTSAGHGLSMMLGTGPFRFLLASTMRSVQGTGLRGE